MAWVTRHIGRWCQDRWTVDRLSSFSQRIGSSKLCVASRSRTWRIHWAPRWWGQSSKGRGRASSSTAPMKTSGWLCRRFFHFCDHLRCRRGSSASFSFPLSNNSLVAPHTAVPSPTACLTRNNIWLQNFKVIKSGSHENLVSFTYQLNRSTELEVQTQCWSGWRNSCSPSELDDWQSECRWSWAQISDSPNFVYKQKDSKELRQTFQCQMVNSRSFDERPQWDQSSKDSVSSSVCWNRQPIVTLCTDICEN